MLWAQENLVDKIRIRFDDKQAGETRRSKTQKCIFVILNPLIALENNLTVSHFTIHCVNLCKNHMRCTYPITDYRFHVNIDSAGKFYVSYNVSHFHKMGVKAF